MSPSGPEAVGAALQRDAERRAQFNGVPKFFMKQGDVAIIKSLAHGMPGDDRFEVRQVHMSTRQNTYDWQPCPTLDAELGTCQCDDLGERWKATFQCGTWVWVYGIWKAELARKRDGKAFDWPKTNLSLPLLQEMYGAARAQTDPWRGERYFQLVNGPAFWMRGKDFNDAFPTEYYYTLTQHSNDGNLTRHDILVMALRGGRSNFGQGFNTNWRYELADPAVNPPMAKIPEIAHGLRTPEVAAEQKRYFEALPPAAAYFENAVKWPLFDEARQTERVPMSTRTAPAEEAAPDSDREREIRESVAARTPDELADLERQLAEARAALAAKQGESDGASEEAGYVHPATLATPSSLNEEDDAEPVGAGARRAPERAPAPQNTPPPADAPRSGVREFID